MKIIKSNYSYLVIFSLLFTILFAWQSLGFINPDEHFQILEFCNYKMGKSLATNLPWEFNQQVRAAFLPGFAYLLGKPMDLLHYYNPFILAFLLRLVSGIASWYVTYKISFLLLPHFNTEQVKKIFIFASMLLWFMLYINVHFTPEQMSGISLLFGCYWILKQKKSSNKEFLHYTTAGFLLGLAFFIRIQMFPAILGLFLWLIIIRKTSWKWIGVLISAIVFAIFINIIIDYWFYGTWTLTPYNYFYVNIIQQKASQFGTSPWWWYFSCFLLIALPFSIIMLPIFIFGIIKNPKDLMVWIAVPFILTHCLIAHKEMRFLLPIIFAFIYLFSRGLDDLISKNHCKNFILKSCSIGFGGCILVLFINLFTPFHSSASAINLLKFLYYTAPEKKQKVFYLTDESVVVFYGLQLNFYLNKAVDYIPIKHVYQIGDYLAENNLKSALFATEQKKINLPGYNCRKVYTNSYYYIELRDTKVRNTRIVWEITRKDGELKKILG